MKQPAVYIMTNTNKTLYIGVTSDLKKRVWQHQNKIVDGFTQEYDLTQLVYYEIHSTMIAAITREKQLKAWRRDKKIRLIESKNPSWEDLWFSL